MRFKFLEHTADVMFEAYGSSLEELFENAALAMFSVICDVSKVKPEQEVSVRVSSETLEFLLVDWLSELLLESDLSDLYFSKFKVKIERPGYRLEGFAYGSERRPEITRTEVKAVSYHMLSVERKGQKWVCRVVLDI